MNTSTWDCAAEGLDRRRAGVAGGRADDGRPRAAPPQRAVHQPAQPLHGEVLERQRRSVEQFEQEQIVVELGERRLRGVAEAGIGGLGQRLRSRPDRNRRRRRASRCAQRLPHREDRQRADCLRRRTGNGSRHIKAAVAGETREHGVGKAERRRLAARRNIMHELGNPWPIGSPSSANCAKGKRGRDLVA